MKKLSTSLVYGILVLTLAFGLFAMPASAADHLDAPGLTPPGGDTRLDITDVYAFQSPTNPENTVLIMGVNPLAGVLNDGTFRAGNALYAFKIDSNGDAKEDVTFRIKFSKPDESVVQSVTFARDGGVDQDLDGSMRNPIAKGKTDEVISI